MIGLAVVDDLDQSLLLGQLEHVLSDGLLTREDVYAEVGDIIAGVRPGRESMDELIVVAPLGVGTVDVAVAAHVARRATRSRLGLEVDLLS